jgi:hypothetical protein
MAAKNVRGTSDTYNQLYPSTVYSQTQSIFEPKQLIGIGSNSSTQGSLGHHDLFFKHSD